MAPTALIADIQRSSIHDGPGLRTTVFFKGCPLRCAWCHNPECISFKPQLLRYPEKCIGCGRCEEGCFSGARVVCGREISVDELMEQILLDKDYYVNGGGVTFSGGEPMAYAAFLDNVLDRCLENNINACIETSMIYFDKSIFKKFNIIMADFKIWDKDLHIKYTGASNEIIKENFIKADNLGTPIVARTPVIPELEQGIADISSYLKRLRNIKRYELLPYNPLGEAKRKALGEETAGFSVPSHELMKELNKYAFIC